jgi:hypothetical protein
MEENKKIKLMQTKQREKFLLEERWNLGFGRNRSSQIPVN